MENSVSIKRLDPAWDQIVAAWTWFAANWKKLVLIVLVGLAPSIVSTIFIIFASPALDFTWSVYHVASIGLLGLGWLIISIIFAIYSSLATYLYILRDDPAMSVTDAFQAANGRVGAYFSVTVLVGLMVLLGIILLIVPGIYFGVIYAFALVIVLQEKKTASEAMKESKRLVRGYWWAMFGRFALYGIVVWAAMLLLGMAEGVLAGTSGADSMYRQLLEHVFSIGTSLVTTPLSVIFTVVLYRNLKKLQGA